jgi:myo-inositol 2-dehydrogenase / D-chiro-inositol 1-dehydrogenase
MRLSNAIPILPPNFQKALVRLHKPEEKITIFRQLKHKPMANSDQFSRRKFISSSTLGTMGVLSATSLLTSCSNQKPKTVEVQLPPLLDQAPDGRPLRAGLIGCGGRGTGAAINFVDAGPNLEIVALGDVFQDKIDQCRAELKAERNIKIDDEKCFVGFDNFEKVIDAGVDVVLLCTPPHFRPAHLEAAINARKHVFVEKPCAVDPVGARSVLVSAKRAEQMGLCIVSGTIRRFQKDFMETQRRVVNGAIGEITGANIIRNGGSLWYRSRNPKWTTWNICCATGLTFAGSRATIL